MGGCGCIRLDVAALRCRTTVAFLAATTTSSQFLLRPNRSRIHTGPNPRFLLASIDRNWFEVSGGVSYTAGNIELSLTADTTAGRDDVQNQSYRGAITLRF